MPSNNTRLCYFPDGSIAKNNVPYTGAPHPACCGASDICLSNGFSVDDVWGACTNQAWDGGCPDRCISEDDYPDGGCSIINLPYEAGEALYCCGTLVSDSNGKVVCPNRQNLFSLGDAHALPGYGLLSNLSNFYVSGSVSASATETSSRTAETCHDTAIRVGVGVPLEVIALASLGWAFLERKRARAYARHPTQSADALPTSQMGPKYPRPVESESRNPTGELMGSEQT